MKAVARFVMALGMALAADAQTLDGVRIEVTPLVAQTFDSITVTRSGDWVNFSGKLRKKSPFLSWQFSVVDANGKSLATAFPNTMAGESGETRNWGKLMAPDKVRAGARVVIHGDKELPGGKRAPGAGQPVTEQQMRSIVGNWTVLERDPEVLDPANSDSFTISSIRFDGQGGGTFVCGFDRRQMDSGRLDLSTGKFWFNTRRQVNGRERPVQYSLQLTPGAAKVSGTGSRIDVTRTSVIDTFGWPVTFVRAR